MKVSEVVGAVGPALAAALENKGFTTLTKVQEAVLDPGLTGRDLRIASQTGSGKTVAIGLLLRDQVAPEAARPGPVQEGIAAASAHEGVAPPPSRPPATDPHRLAGPRVLVIEPTRELARQVERELAWLYAPLGARVTSVAGGSAYRDELRSLSRGPAVVVGTPGRLLDHVNRGSVDLSEIQSVVLDESDSILDLGFRDDLEAILAHTPPTRNTHLVSATFAPDVRAFADRVQTNPLKVEGTPIGVAHTDIEHLLHLVDPRQTVDALVNLMLAYPDEQMIVFVRTRADVRRVADELEDTGFCVAALSGEMEQFQRNQALASFKLGKVRALVATDVAARGIDVPDIARVVHLEPPGDAESYTHRSGRTGRAGRKGTSSTFVDPSGLQWTIRLLRRAGVSYRFEPIPSADEIRRREDDLALAKLTSSDATTPVDPRTAALAQRIAAAADPVRAIERLLERWRQDRMPAAREVDTIAPPAPRAAQTPRAQGGVAARQQQDRWHERRPDRGDRGKDRQPDRDNRSHDRAARRSDGWVPFHVTWGARHGADARRLLASVCRRGAIQAADVGSIRIGPTSSVIEISAPIAASFAEAASKTDERDPRVRILPFESRETWNKEPPSSYEQAEREPSHRDHAYHTHADPKPWRAEPPSHKKTGRAKATPPPPPGAAPHANTRGRAGGWDRSSGARSH